MISLFINGIDQSLRGGLAQVQCHSLFIWCRANALLNIYLKVGANPRLFSHFIILGFFFFHFIVSAVL